MLTIKNLTISVGDKIIVRDFSYTFEMNKVYVIMGPNGSGKSTLAHALMGNTIYKVQFFPQSGILPCRTIFNFQNETGEIIDLGGLKTDERAKAGIFLSFQTPLALQGIRPSQLLQLAVGKSKSAIDLRKEIKQIAGELQIPEELLNRGLNEGASGGERKKLEVLQAAILNKPIQIFDEIDTGVDVDAIRLVGTFLNAHKAGKTYIIITHSSRILKYIQPDHVLIMEDGTLTREGDHTLVSLIEEKGYGDEKVLNSKF